MSTNGSLLHICALIIWPLLFSISTLLWSERQADTIHYLIKAKASLYTLDRDIQFERDTGAKIQSIQKELRAESRHHAHALRALKTSQRAKFVRLKVYSQTSLFSDFFQVLFIGHSGR